MKEREQSKIIISSYFVILISGYLKTINPWFETLKVTTILSGFWWLYFNYLWKLPVFKKLVFKENLNGIWFGTYESVNLKSDEGIQCTGEIAVRIHQTYLNIGIKTLTKRFNNFSFAETLKYENNNNLYRLHYFYSQKESKEFEPTSRPGVSSLELKKRGKDYYLEGEFWTNHGTNGKLKVKRIDNKTVDIFEEAKKINDEQLILQ